jgi:hypothetical protein
VEEITSGPQLYRQAFGNNKMNFAVQHIAGNERADRLGEFCRRSAPPVARHDFSKIYLKIDLDGQQKEMLSFSGLRRAPVEPGVPDDNKEEQSSVCPRSATYVKQ